MTRKILKTKIYPDTAMVTLSENKFTLNFCRVVFENFDPIILSKYGSGKETNSMEFVLRTESKSQFNL